MLYNGAPKSDRLFYQVGHLKKLVHNGKEVESTGPLGPFEYLSTLEESEVVLFTKKAFVDGEDKVTAFLSKNQPKDRMC